jgi:hypothetical protein
MHGFPSAPSRVSRRRRGRYVVEDGVEPSLQLGRAAIQEVDRRRMAIGLSVIDDVPGLLLPSSRHVIPLPRPPSLVDALSCGEARS